MSFTIRPARGRTAPGPARPLNASTAAGSRTKPPASSAKPSTSATSRTLNQSTATRPKTSSATAARSSQLRTHAEPATRVRATTTGRGTPLGAGGSTPSSASAFGGPKVLPRVREVRPTETTDELQLAAQSCAWLYMTSTLEDELGRSDNAAHVALEARRKELVTEEADIADSRVRYEAERMLDFYGELSDRKVAGEIAGVIQRFTLLERVVGEATTACLRLTSLPVDDTTNVQQYNDVLHLLDGLEDECQKLEEEVLSLLGDASSQDGRLPRVLNSLLDILHGYAGNVACAQSIVRCCKESYRMAIGTLTLD